MKRDWLFRLLIAALIPCVLTACLAPAYAQEAGNAAYGGQRRKTSGVGTGNLSMTDPKDAVISHFIEANVLLNAKPDEYIAVFGVAQEGANVADSNQKLDARLQPFLASLQSIGIGKSDIFVDFITQNRVYDYAVAGNTVSEKLVGFEVKKNVAVRYKDAALLDRLLAAAAKSNIFDLVKVEYVINDMPRVRAALMAEAARIVKQKADSYANLLNIKMQPVAVFQEKYNAFFPAEMYAAYTAYESGNVAEHRANVNVLQRRKSSTFYYNPLHPGEFDAVLNSGSVEPMVQCTLYLKVKYAPAL